MNHLSGWGDNSNRLFRPVAPGFDFSQNERSLLENILNDLPLSKSKHSISQHLFARFGDLRNVFFASTGELASIEGLTPLAARKLSETGQLLKAVLQAKIADKPALQNLDEVMAYCAMILAGATREQFHCLFLDNAMELIAHDCLQVGTTNHVAIYPRELIGRALHHAASAVILVHNHPSSNTRPSNGDIHMTRELAKIGKLMGVTVADHIIVSRQATFSFKREALI